MHAVVPGTPAITIVIAQIYVVDLKEARTVDYFFHSKKMDNAVDKQQHIQS